MNHNCIVTIYRMTGTESSKTYTSSSTGVKVMATPASPQIVALYDAPIGATYAINALEADIQNADKLVVTDAETGALVVNSTFIVQGKPESIVMAGHKIVSAVAVLI